MKINPAPVPMAAAGKLPQAQAGRQLNAQQETQSFVKLLEQAKASNDDQALQEACRQFEAYFLQHLLKGLRSTIPEGGLIPKSYAQEIYQDMLDEQYAEGMSRAGGIGLAQILYQDLTRDK